MPSIASSPRPSAPYTFSSLDEITHYFAITEERWGETTLDVLADAQWTGMRWAQIAQRLHVPLLIASYVGCMVFAIAYVENSRLWLSIAIAMIAQFPIAGLAWGASVPTKQVCIAWKRRMIVDGNREVPFAGTRLAIAATPYGYTVHASGVLIGYFQDAALAQEYCRVIALRTLS
jgi:hypothetical protein